jgi:hypothetical protein
LEVSSIVPPWVALVLGLASSVVAVVAIVANEFRDRRRLKHERETQQREHEERFRSRLREERIRAYATLARLTKRVDVSVEEPELPAVAEAHSEVELLAENPKLREVSDELFQTWESAWRSVRNAGAPDPYDVPGFKNVRGLLDGLREAFIELAKDEIGVKTLSREEPPEGSIPTEPTDDPETPASRS